MVACSIILCTYLEAPAEPPGERESPQTVEDEPERAEKAPARHRRRSGGRTAPLVAEADRGMSAFSYTVASIVFGGIVSAVISYYFARRASRELRREADGLRRETEDVRHYVNALISYLEAAGSIEVRRDEAGRPIDVRIIYLSGTISGGGSMSGNLTVGEGDQPEGENNTPQGDEN